MVTHECIIHTARGWGGFVAKCATGSGVVCSVRPQLCNMNITLTAGSIIWVSVCGTQSPYTNEIHVIYNYLYILLLLSDQS